MKKIILLFLFCLLCGCSTEYQLNIKGDKIEENIKLSINNSEIIDEELAPDMSLKSRDSIEYLKTGDLYPVLNNKLDVYERNVSEVDNVTTIDLKYSYKKDQFQNSKIINECFEKKEIYMSKGKISIHLSGKFSCLENKNETLDFKIVTGNKIDYANIEYGIFDKEYVWQIDSTNSNNVDIQNFIFKKNKNIFFFFLL